VNGEFPKLFQDAVHAGVAELIADQGGKNSSAKFIVSFHGERG
jgi:hypothetical protein